MKANIAVAGKKPVLRPSKYLPLELIVDHEELGNHRPIDKEWVAELTESIKKVGLDNPLYVWDGGEEYPEMKVAGKVQPSSFLVAGFQRRAALKAIRKEDSATFDKLFPNGVPVRVFGGEIKDMLCLQLRENVARKNPTAEELLPQILRLQKEFNMKGKVIASRIGRSASFVSQILDIEEELGEEGVKEVIAGGVSAKHALRAAKEAKEARKAGQSVDAKALVGKAKAASAAQKEAGRERGEAKVGIARLWKVYKALPAMSDSDKLGILEKTVAYVVGEREKYPRQLKLDSEKASKAASEE
jgi:ParB-like chromosome segregation protein Spo0J